MLRRIALLGSSVTALALCDATVAAAQTPTPTLAPEPFQRRAPAGAPNVVVVLLDDVGFGAASTFGGPGRTPALDALAAEGLRYNRFHTTAICTPTRAALLTGRNAHAVGLGAVMNVADDRPGYTGFQSRTAAPLAEILRTNGYSTAAFGKWHQTPDWELTQSGPFDRWPTGQGFESFYGFQGGETDQFEPTLFRGTTPVQRPPGPGYHLTQDLAEESIRWLHAQQSATPDKPFFLYFAPGGVHAPLQAPTEWIARYRGQFDQGWDKMREETFARQKRLGVIPADTVLTKRPEAMPAWDSLTPEEKRFSARLMETYAAFLSHTDAQVGRLVQALKDSGEFDNTLFVYVVGDNGASAEGGLAGSINYLGQLTGSAEPQEARRRGLERIGGPQSYAHFNASWAWAMNTPFQWTKAVASHLGGTRNGLVVSWPKKITDKGGLRTQFGHVNDIAPTILEAAGIPEPKVVAGVPQQPMDGASLVYSFAAPKAPERHGVQYFEVFGHRAIYKDGWMASAFHTRLPWRAGFDPAKPFEADTWELYDLRSDFSQARNLAAANPDKLRELQAVFLTEAEKNKVLPLAGMRPLRPGLPDLAKGVRSRTYYPGTIGTPESAVPKTLNRSWSLSANLKTTARSQGVVATLGGFSAGWSLYIDEQQRPVFTYKNFEAQTVHLVGQRPLAAGAHALKVDFHYAGGLGGGGRLVLSVDARAVAEDTLKSTPLAIYSNNETFDVGMDTGSPGGRYPAEAPLGYPMPDGTIVDVTLAS